MKEKKLKYSPELQKLNVEAGVDSNSKKMWLRKKMFKSLIRFHSSNKIDNNNRGGKEGEKKKKKIQNNLQKSEHKKCKCFS